MKRTALLFALVLILTSLLCACAGGPEQWGNNTTGSTVTSDRDSTATSTTGTEANEDTASTDGQEAPAVLSTEKEFETFFKNNLLYRRALSCTFENPEDISAWYYFYNGVDNIEVKRKAYTAEEESFIKNTLGDLSVSTPVKLPVTEINKDLAILGITIENIQIPDRWKYYEKTDAYYFAVSDAYGVGRFSVTNVDKDEDGMVKVYWETTEVYASHFNTSTNEHFPRGKMKMVITMQLQPDGTYRVLSNLPQEET